MTEFEVTNEIIENEQIETELAESTSEPEEQAKSTEEEDNVAPASELESLRAEVSALKAQLDSERAIYGRMSTECAEFTDLYPDVPLASIPDSIWESVKKGVPIAAAYALHERKNALAKMKAEMVNSANSRTSSGSIDSHTAEDYYSPDEVRAMSAAEVRKNYSNIIRSMSKWH